MIPIDFLRTQSSFRMACSAEHHWQFHNKTCHKQKKRKTLFSFFRNIGVFKAIGLETDQVKRSAKLLQDNQLHKHRGESKYSNQ
jgi:hypothetical protein